MEYEVIKEEKFAAFKFSTEKLTAIIAPSVKADIIVLNEEGYSNFILDLSNVQYCDSSGLSAILVANRVAKENRGILVVCSLQPSVDKLIKISQLDGILNIVPSYNEAMDYIFMEELEKGLDDIF
ncbi:STAS domain-containing protein [bacterium]|nr:STAS domain-containing protein [bacterium]